MLNPKKVLLLRFSSIGDIVLCSPVVRCLKHQLPELELHFLTKKKYNSLLDQNQNIDKLWSIQKEIDEVIDDLKKENFDLIIDLHKNIRTFRLKQLLGIPSISFDKLNAAKWLRVHTPINILPKKHLVDRYLEAISPMGIRDDGQGLDFFYDVNAEQLLSKHGLNKNEYVVIVLGATYKTKRVPTQLLVPLFRDKKSKYVLLGGNDTKERGTWLSSKFPEIINLTDQLTLQQSACLLDYSNVVVTGDTGMMHIAAALNKPIISIWGSTHHDLGMYPYYGTNKVDLNVSIVNKDITCAPCSKIGKGECPKKHFKCMTDLNYSMLVDALEIQKKLKQKTLS